MRRIRRPIFEREVSAFVHKATQIQELGRLSVPLASCFDDEW